VSGGATLRSARTTVAGLRLFARWSPGPLASDRTPIVLVHGFGMSSRYMVPLARELASKRPVYAPDLPGHGRSETPPRRAQSVPEQADTLVAWMRVTGLPRAFVLGNSLGAQIAVEAAVRHPAAVGRLVLLGPTLDSSARTLPRQAGRVLASALAEQPSLVPVVLRAYARMGPRLLQELRFMFAHHIEDLLPRLSQPTLVVRGERDAVAPQAWAEEVARLAGAGPPRVVPRWGHGLNYSAPRQLAGVIEPFLAEGDGSGAGSAVPREPTTG
jgi:pimeloyl-ACP methyl ester carboxylesterase